MMEIRTLLHEQSQEREKLQEYLANLQIKIEARDRSFDNRLSALEQQSVYLEADRKILIERITRLESQHRDAQRVVWKIMCQVNELQHPESEPKEGANK